MHDEINVFGLFKLPTFGVMIAIGVLFLILLLFYYLRKNKVPESKIDSIFIIGAVSGMFFALGAYFFDALWHGIEIAKNTGKPFSFDFGGITFSGGLFTGILCYFIIYLIVMKYERQNVFYYFDIFAIGICIAHAFGRIGCFFGGCCYGKVVESGTFLSMLYPTDNGWLTVYPTQLYESAFLFLLFFALVFLVKKNKTAVYLISYNVFRFLLEYLRGDDRGASPFGMLSPSQFMSIIMLIWGIIILFFRHKIEGFLLTKNKLSDDYPSNDVERNGNGITYQNNFLNKINKNFSGLIIAMLMIFSLTIISFAVIANGVSERGSLKQAKKKLDDNIWELTYNNNNYQMVPIIDKFAGKDTLYVTCIEDNYTFVYVPEENFVRVTKKNDKDFEIIFNATYVYRYQLFKENGTKKPGKAVDIKVINDIDYSKLGSIELNSLKEFTIEFTNQSADNIANMTYSALPIFFIVLIVSEFICILTYVWFYFFGKKYFKKIIDSTEDSLIS